jgi:hypothetical protein
MHKTVYKKPIATCTLIEGMHFVATSISNVSGVDNLDVASGGTSENGISAGNVKGENIDWDDAW